MSRLDDRGEQIVFGDESGCRGNTRQRQHKNEHEGRSRWMPEKESVEVFYIFADHIPTAKGDDNRPRPDVHECVHEQIQRYSGHTGVVACDQAEENKTRMRNGRIRQHPFDVGLRESRDIADGNGHHGDRRQNRNPLVT